MRSFIVILICSISLSYMSVKAQPMAGSGCISKTSPNRVYQIAAASYLGLPTFNGAAGVRYSEWTVQYDITAYPCYTWTKTTNNGCYIKNGLSYTLGNYGYFTGTSGVNCPIDDYVLPLIGLVALLSFHQIKRRYLLT